MADTSRYWYTVRVELYNLKDEESSSVYENLHLAMAQEGFRRTIISSNSVELHLPNAEYSFITGKLTTNSILAKAKRAALLAKGDMEFGILVTRSIEPRKMFNLKPVYNK